MSARDAPPPASRTPTHRKARAKPEGALSADEVRLLRAFRTMDDRARRMQLRLGLRAAKDRPRSEPFEPVIEEDEVLLQADYRSMDDVRKREIRQLAAWLAEHHPAIDRADSLVVERPGLRLVVDNRAMGATGGKREMTW